MARQSDLLLGANRAFNTSSTVPKVNIAGINAGQNGLLPDLRGLAANASYMKSNTICVVLQTPRGFNHLPNPEEWHAAFKALLETGSNSIEGLNSTINVEYGQNPLGASGEQQDDWAKVTRERSQPVHVIREKYGKPVKAMMDSYIRYLIADPETQVPLVMSLTDAPTDQLPDFTSFTCLYFEPDPLHKFVQDAWLVTNMMPDTGGEVVGRRDLTASRESVDYTITWTGIQQVGAGVNQMAQGILDRMALSGINPTNRAAFMSEINADLTNTDQGYAEVMQQAASDSVI